MNIFCQPKGETLTKTNRDYHLARGEWYIN
nr:MAG TPA: hypothetical protein [Caudoviricetes sp.]